MGAEWSSRCHSYNDEWCISDWGACCAGFKVRWVKNDDDDHDDEDEDDDTTTMTMMIVMTMKVSVTVMVMMTIMIIIMSSVWTVRFFSFTPLEWQRARRDKNGFLFYLVLWLTPLFTRGSAPLVRATPITLKKIRDCLRSKLSTTKNIYHWYTSWHMSNRYFMFSAFKSFLSCRGSCCFKEQSNQRLQESKI